MPARRTVATSFACLLAVGALSACERESPWVTLYSSGDTVKNRAAVYCFEDQSLEAGDCREEPGEPVRLPVSRDAQIAVDVDASLLDRGFTAVVGDQRVADVQFEHYMTFSLPTGFQLPAEGLPMQVIAMSGEDDPDTISAIYSFELVRG
jgi:hypothetical protein